MNPFEVFTAFSAQCLMYYCYSKRNNGLNFTCSWIRDLLFTRWRYRIFAQHTNVVTFERSRYDLSHRSLVPLSSSLPSVLFNYITEYYCNSFYAYARQIDHAPADFDGLSQSRMVPQSGRSTLLPKSFRIYHSPVIAL